MAGAAGKSGSATIGSIAILEASVNLTDASELVDITNLESSGWREMVEGIESWTVEISGFVDASTAPTKPNGLQSCTLSDGTFTSSGNGFVESLRHGYDARGAITLEMTIQGTGPLTDWA